MNTFPILLGALCVYAIAYRYYSAFIAAKAMSLDDRRTTPAHLYADGHNYVASPRWVLFGHHFAAIAGAGPLVGPTLAAQFGFAPGFLWILVGAVLAGCVQDFTVLVASVRHRGRSLANVASTEISPFAGLVAMIAVLFILLATLAGLGLVVEAHATKGYHPIGSGIGQNCSTDGSATCPGFRKRPGCSRLNCSRSRQAADDGRATTESYTGRYQRSGEWRWGV